jgi:hypothetical protein
MPAIRRPDEDDDLGELPPLDGTADESDVEPPPEELEDVPTDDGDPFDDATAEKPSDLEDVPEIAAATDERGLLEDAADAEDLDVGAHELDDDERAGLLDDADEPGVGEEDFGLEQASESLVIDAGEEGPDADDEELREEDLPRLDADEDGELDDEALTDEWPAAQDEERPAWDDRAWERASDVPRTGMARSVVPLDDGAAVAGASLVLFSGQGATPVDMKGIHGGAIVGVARFDGQLAVATERGGVFLGSSSGAFREVGRVEGTPADLASDATRLWLRTRAGGLFSASGDGAWEKHFGTGVEALTLVAGVPLAITGGRVVRGLERTPVGAPLPPLPPGATPMLRARGDVILVGAFGAGAFRAKDGGAWERIEGTTNVTALALLDDAGSAVVALHSAVEDRAWIARAAAGDAARIVAELGGDADQDEDPRVLELAWDERAKMLWAVGPFGVAVLRPR